MPDFLQTLSLGSPLRYYMDVIPGIFLKGIGIDMLWPQALALTRISALLFGIAALAFRYQQPELMVMGMSYLWTGQCRCYDPSGKEIPCRGTGQDGELARGRPWPALRFSAAGDVVSDRLTGLVWTRTANAAGYPLTWSEAFEFVAGMNRARAFGCQDWRLPNRRELRSLVSHQTRRPALPEGHPFRDVFPGWYWSSTTAAISPAHAWYVHMDGARMFYGGKDQSFLVWPVRGAGNGALAATGQTGCYDSHGGFVACGDSGQDGELRCGRTWPVPRFTRRGGVLVDRLTGLAWQAAADLAGGAVTWAHALAAVRELNVQGTGPPWRLPNINELESLVDCDRHAPALPIDAVFTDLRDGYWSSTSSAYEPDWAWALYLTKGAVGVGQKNGAHFHVWAVRDSV